VGLFFAFDFCPFVKASAETDQNPGMPGIDQISD